MFDIQPNSFETCEGRFSPDDFVQRGFGFGQGNTSGVPQVSSHSATWAWGTTSPFAIRLHRFCIDACVLDLIRLKDRLGFGFSHGRALSLHASYIAQFGPERGMSVFGLTPGVGQTERTDREGGNQGPSDRAASDDRCGQAAQPDRQPGSVAPVRR